MAESEPGSQCLAFGPEGGGGYGAIPAGTLWGSALCGSGSLGPALALSSLLFNSLLVRFS